MTNPMFEAALGGAEPRHVEGCDLMLATRG